MAQLIVGRITRHRSSEQTKNTMLSQKQKALKVIIFTTRSHHKKRIFFSS